MLSMVLNHSDVYDKHGHVITTSVTTLDIHDIARSCRTYGLGGFYPIHPNHMMHEIMQRVIGHWSDGSGSVINPDRQQAFGIVKPVYSLQKVIDDIRQRTGETPYMVATTARPMPGAINMQELKKNVYKRKPLCIILGSGWGLTDEFISTMDAVLKPIETGSGYNHLSVRAAAAIMLDRFFGDER